MAASLEAALHHPSPLSPSLYRYRHRHGPCSTSFRLPLQPPPRPCLRRTSILAETTSSSSNSSGNHGLHDLASRLMDRAGQLLEAASLKAVQFGESSDLSGKLQQALKTANQKMEEMSYDARKMAEKLDRRFGISQRAHEIADFASQQAKNVDQQFGIVQKVRTASSDFRRNWPMYRRRLDNFFQTPLGKILTTLAFMWFLLSGWLFRIVFFSLWVLPFAAPVLISTAARNAVVEGACPSCKRRFVGYRGQMVVCNYCRAVVWQPRQDFSKEQSDPSIIDIDID